MATTTPELTRSQISEIIRTRRPINGIGEMRAVAHLASGALPDAQPMLQDLVMNRSNEPRIRSMAALGLYRTERRRRDTVLAEAASQADQWTAGPLALGLGRVGLEDRLPLLEQLDRTTSPNLRPQTRFAKTLLSYRHDLDVEPIDRPRSDRLQKIESRRQTVSIEFAKAGRRDAASALDVLTHEPLDVELTATNAQRLDCGPNVFVWLWAAEALAEIESLGSRKRLAGVLTRQGRLTKHHSLSRIVLATPSRSEVSLTVHRAITGEVEYAGVLSADGSFSLQATKRPGLAAIEIRGTASPTQVVVSAARSANVVRAPKTPERQ